MLFTAPAPRGACLGLLEGKHRAQLIKLITGRLVSLAASFGVLCGPAWPGTHQARPPHGWHCHGTAMNRWVPHRPQGQMAPSFFPRSDCAQNPKLKVLVPGQRISSKSQCCREVTGLPVTLLSGPALMDVGFCALMINQKANKHNSSGMGQGPIPGSPRRSRYGAEDVWEPLVRHWVLSTPWFCPHPATLAHTPQCQHHSQP